MDHLLFLISRNISQTKEQPTKTDNESNGEHVIGTSTSLYDTDPIPSKHQKSPQTCIIYQEKIGVVRRALAAKSSSPMRTFSPSFLHLPHTEDHPARPGHWS